LEIRKVTDQTDNAIAPQAGQGANTLPGPIPAAGGVPPAASEVKAGTPNEHGVFLLPETIDVGRLLKTNHVCSDAFVKKLEMYVTLARGEDRVWHFGFSMRFLDEEESSAWSSPCSISTKADSRESAFRMAIGKMLPLIDEDIANPPGRNKHHFQWKGARDYLHDTWGKGKVPQAATIADDGTPASAEGFGESQTPRPPEATAAEPLDTEPSAPASAPEVLSAQLSTSATCRTPAETAIVRMVLDAGLPAEVPAVTAIALDELMDSIRKAEQTGHREAIRICCLVAAVRIRFFAKDTPGWLAVMEREFGYEKRFSYTCLKVGRFVLETLLGLRLGNGDGVASGYSLSRSTVAVLLLCDLRKLERIAEIPPEHLTRFVEQHPDLATTGRDPVFAYATKFIGRLPAATKEEKMDARKLERKEELAKAREQPEWKLDHAAHEIVKLAAKTQAQFGKVDAGHAFRAGFCLQKAAADSLERGESPLGDEDLASIEHNLVQVLEFVRKQRNPQG
jgi:hypothetical protein